MLSPVYCNYAPPGEYVKDHTLLYHDGWWHLLSISGTRGYSHLYSGNEETISWSISRDLVNWEFRGHVLHASLREGEFDQHEVWAPFCMKADGRFLLFYAGVVHPMRPMTYERMGTECPNQVWEGHRETLGLAMSEDLTAWRKVSDRCWGLGLPGRDPHVVYDGVNSRWLLYSTGGRRGNLFQEYVSQSHDLINWEYIGVCAEFPPFDQVGFSSSESMTVMRHPLNGRWIMMGNWHYVLSDDPLDFSRGTVHEYFDSGEPTNAAIGQLGFAAETIEWNGRWYRSGVLGVMDHWVLGFHEIEWDSGGAFHITTPSIVKWQF